VTNPPSPAARCGFSLAVPYDRPGGKASHTAYFLDDEGFVNVWGHDQTTGSMIHDGAHPISKFWQAFTGRPLPHSVGAYVGTVTPHSGEPSKDPLPRFILPDNQVLYPHWCLRADEPPLWSQVTTSPPLPKGATNPMTSALPKKFLRHHQSITAATHTPADESVIVFYTDATYSVVGDQGTHYPTLNDLDNKPLTVKCAYRGPESKDDFLGLRVSDGTTWYVCRENYDLQASNQDSDLTKSPLTVTNDPPWKVTGGVWVAGQSFGRS
jgi:hypothetical protein